MGACLEYVPMEKENLLAKNMYLWKRKICLPRICTYGKARSACLDRCLFRICTYVKGISACLDGCLLRICTYGKGKSACLEYVPMKKEDLLAYNMYLWKRKICLLRTCTYGKGRSACLVRCLLRICTYGRRSACLEYVPMEEDLPA